MCAFPYLDEVNFELGTRGNFDSETDTGSKLDFPHYSDLAKDPRIKLAPYRGAFCMRIDNSIGTEDAFVTETGTWDMALSENQHWRFKFAISDVTMANNDEFAIFKLISASGDEAVIVVNFTTANGLRIGVGETGGSQFLPLQTGVWHDVELDVNLSSGAADGTLDLRLDGAAATQVGSLTQAAITSGQLGVDDQDAGTTGGILLFDQVVTDDARIFPSEQRFSETVLMTTDGHVFVGRGCINNVSLLSGAGTDCVLTIFDTDRGNTDDAGKIVTELKNTANNELVDPAGMPVRVDRGCFVQMTGTDPRALVQIEKAFHYSSDGAIRNYGAKWKPTPRNV